MNDSVFSHKYKTLKSKKEIGCKGKNLTDKIDLISFNAFET